MLMRDVLREHAIYNGRRPAIVDGDITITYSALRGRVLRLANALQGLGAKPGDRVAILSLNSHRFYEWYFACCESGLVGVPLNVRLSPGELVTYANYLEPSFLVVESQFAVIAKQMQAQVPSLRHVVGCSDRHGLPLDYEQLLAESRETELDVQVDPHGPCLLVGTSGTTGTYKATIMSQAYTYASVLSFLATHRVDRSSRWLQTLPMFFATAGPAHHTALVAGGTVYVVPAFNANLIAGTIRQERITHIYLVPTMLYEMLDHQPDYGNLGSVDVIGVGGSAFTEPRFRQTVDAVGPRLYVTYGCSEGWGTTLTPADYWEGDRLNARCASVGKPQPNIAVRVIHLDGSLVERDGEATGEVAFKGECTALGYWKMAEESEHAFRDGWFHTGDVATIDEDGFLYLVDRMKDLIISGGINIASAEVESVIAGHPGVALVAVIGIPDPLWGESVKAVVQLKTGTTVTEQEIIDWCKERLASFKKPSSVDFVDVMPMTASGKILKRELRARYPQE